MDSSTGNTLWISVLVISASSSSQITCAYHVKKKKKGQKLHEHIGRRGMEQVTSCDPDHKVSCRQGRDTAVQTLPLHPAFALAGHSSLPQLLRNCF